MDYPVFIPLSMLLTLQKDDFRVTHSFIGMLVCYITNRRRARPRDTASYSGRSKVQGWPGLYSKFKANLDNLVRPGFKIKLLKGQEI